MTAGAYARFDGFWRQFFADRIAAGTPQEKILASVVVLNLQRVDRPVDLALCAGMPNLREIIAPLGDVAVTGKEVIAGIPTLRELVLSQGAFTADDLPGIVKSPTLAKLHINGMHLPSLAALNDAARLKELRLHRVTGVAAAELAALRAVTTLRLSEGDYGDLAELARMPRLRTLELQKVPLAGLRCLAAPKLMAFSADARAADESGLALLSGKTQLQEFLYPVSHLPVLTACAKLARLRVDGSGELDFSVIAHLPVTAIEVYSAPDEQTAKAILARARETWPGLRSMGYRHDWDLPGRTPASAQFQPPEAARTTPVPSIPSRPPGLLGRLFGKG